MLALPILSLMLFAGLTASMSLTPEQEEIQVQNVKTELTARVDFYSALSTRFQEGDWEGAQAICDKAPAMCYIESSPENDIQAQIMTLKSLGEGEANTIAPGFTYLSLIKNGGVLPAEVDTPAARKRVKEIAKRRNMDSVHIRAQALKNQKALDKFMKELKKQESKKKSALGKIASRSRSKDVASTNEISVDTKARVLAKAIVAVIAGVSGGAIFLAAFVYTILSIIAGVAFNCALGIAACGVGLGAVVVECAACLADLPFSICCGCSPFSCFTGLTEGLLGCGFDLVGSLGGCVLGGLVTVGVEGMLLGAALMGLSEESRGKVQEKLTIGPYNA